MKIKFIASSIFLACLSCALFESNDIDSYEDLNGLPINLLSIDMYADVSSNASTQMVTSLMNRIDEPSPQGKLTRKLTLHFFNEYSSKVRLRSKPEGEQPGEELNLIINRYLDNGNLYSMNIVRNNEEVEKYTFTYDPESGRLQTLVTEINAGHMEQKTTDQLQYDLNGHILKITRNSDFLPDEEVIDFFFTGGKSYFSRGGTDYILDEQYCYADQCNTWLRTEPPAGSLRITQQLTRTVYGATGEVVIDENGSPETYGEFFFHPLMIAVLPKDAKANYLASFAFDWWHPLTPSERGPHDVTMNYAYEY